MVREKEHQSLDCPPHRHKNFDLTPLVCARFVIYFSSLSSMEWERRAV